MIAELSLPRLGETMETGRVVAWMKQPGERFTRGEILLEIESDKTVVEMPALADGVLVEILVSAGQDADVGASLCRYEDGATAAAEAEPPAPIAAIPPQTDPRVRATPLARSVARQNDISLESIVGTGRRGRIEAEDVRGAIGPGSDLPGVTLPGGRIAYRSWGKASPDAATVVLLHGFGGDSQTWAGLAGTLARGGAHVVAPDLPGHGETTVAADSFRAVADSVGAFLAAIGSGPFELAGHSLGGAIAARLASRHASRLTLIAPAGLDRAIDAGFIRDLARVRNGGALAHLTRRLAQRPPVLSAAQLDSMAGELERGRLVALAEALVDEAGQCLDITADLRALSMPVRIVWGLQDRIIPWTQATQAGSRVAVHFVPDAGHVPHWDQPAEIAALFA